MDEERFRNAIALRDSGQLAAAVEELHGLEVSTSDAEKKAYILLIQSGCYFEMGKIKEAWESLRQAKHLCPPTELILYLESQEAMLLCEGGQHCEGLKKLDLLWKHYRAVLEKPDHRGLYETVQVKRGILILQLRRVREAKPVLEEARSFQLTEDKRQSVACNLGICYLESGASDRAEELLIEAVHCRSEGPYEIVAHYNLGVIYFCKAAYAKALLEFEWCESNSNRAGPPKEFLFGWLAKTCRALGQNDRAEKYERLMKEAG